MPEIQPICEHNGHPVYLKTGKFGTYLAWNGRTVSFTAGSDATFESGDRDRAQAQAQTQARVVAAIEAKYPSVAPNTEGAKDPVPTYVPGNYQKKGVPRKLTPFILLCQNRKTGEYLLRCSPPNETGATVYCIDAYPGDPAKATDGSLLAWASARWPLPL